MALTVVGSLRYFSLGYAERKTAAATREYMQRQRKCQTAGTSLVQLYSLDFILPSCSRKHSNQFRSLGGARCVRTSCTSPSTPTNRATWHTNVCSLLLQRRPCMSKPPPFRRCMNASEIGCVGPDSASPANMYSLDLGYALIHAQGSWPRGLSSGCMFDHNIYAFDGPGQCLRAEPLVGAKALLNCRLQCG